MGEINYIQAAAAAAMEIEIPEELGWSKRKRVPRKLADALNGCLCGQVLDSSLNRYSNVNKLVVRLGG